MKMNSFIAGLLASLIVFGGGYFVSRVIWTYIDGGYGHGPGLSHLFLLGLFVMCIWWMIIGLTKRKNNNSGRFWIGSSVMNFCFIGFVTTYLIIDFNKDTGARADVPKQSLIIHRIDSGSVVLNQDGDTLLYDKGDSTIIDRRNEVDYQDLKIKDSVRKAE